MHRFRLEEVELKEIVYGLGLVCRRWIDPDKYVTRTCFASKVSADRTSDLNQTQDGIQALQNAQLIPSDRLSCTNQNNFQRVVQWIVHCPIGQLPFTCGTPISENPGQRFSTGSQKSNVTVIRGPRGSGKSMFMRYLTLAVDTICLDVCPIYIEVASVPPSQFVDLTTQVKAALLSHFKNCESEQKQIHRMEQIDALGAYCKKKDVRLCLLLDDAQRLFHGANNCTDELLRLLSYENNACAVLNEYPQGIIWKALHPYVNLIGVGVNSFDE